MAVNSVKKSSVIKEEENEFSFRELLVKSMNYVPLFIIFLVVSLLVAVIYIRYQKPVYSTNIKLLLKDLNNRSTQTTNISDQVLPQVYFTPRTTLANETEMLKSQALMERVVQKQQLNTIYHSVGNINTFELFETDPNSKFIVFTAIRDSSRSHNITIKVVNGEVFMMHGEEETKLPNKRLVSTPQYDYLVNISDFSTYRPEYKYSATWVPTPTVASGLAGALGISPLSKDASILVISMASEVPRKAEVVLNTLVKEYYNYNIEQTNRIADNTIQFIDERLLVISGELSDVEGSIQHFRENNALDITARGALEEGMATELENKLNDQELQLNVADMVGRYIRNPSRRYELVPSNLGIADVTLNALIANYNEGVLKREDMLKTLGIENVEVKALESELDGLRDKISESVDNVKATYRENYNAADKKYRETLSSIRSIPEKQRRLLEIERQQGIKEKLYLYLLQKREESAISRAAAIGKSQSVDVAKSGGPINIKNSNIYLVALFAGLGLPFLIVYLMDLLNDRVTTRDEILKFTDTPIIGEITHFAGGDRAIVAEKTRGVLSEQFRIVRTNLRYFLPKDKLGACVLVTSTMPGEGKTFISLNLGAVLAVSGKKTVLVGFDLRRPKIAETLTLTESPNDLPGFLATGGNPGDIIKKVNGVDNLYVITTKFIPPNPAELLLSEHINTLFSYLKQHFDYIVLDTPPLGVVSDAKVLSEFADFSIYIVRQRFTQRRQLKVLDEIYHEKRLPNLALIVNDVKLKGIRSYYGYGYTYGGSYGYDYSMGYGGYSNSSNGNRLKWKKLFKLRK